MGELPEDIYLQIFIHTSRSDLLQLRLANKWLSILCTELAFKTLELCSTRDSVERVEDILAHKHLRHIVRRVTLKHIDTSGTPSKSAKDALSKLSQFPHLRSIHISYTSQLDREACRRHSQPIRDALSHFQNCLITSLRAIPTLERATFEQNVPCDAAGSALGVLSTDTLNQISLRSLKIQCRPTPSKSSNNEGLSYLSLPTALLLATAHSLSELTLEADGDSHNYIALVNWTKISLPSLKYLTLRRLVFTACGGPHDMEQFINSHGHTLRELHLDGCLILSEGKDNLPLRTWNDVCSQWWDRLPVLRTFTFSPSLRKSEDLYTTKDVGAGKIKLDMEALEGLVRSHP